jgi:hypothetical protein
MTHETNQADAGVPEVGAREPCPCGSGRRYKACHGKRRAVEPHIQRPFAGLSAEPDWVALREVVPAATAPLSLGAASTAHAGRDVVLATVLPLGWPAMVRGDGTVFVGLQVAGRSGDASRDVAAAMLEALEQAPGSAVTTTGRPGPGPRLQDLLAAAPLEVSVHTGFDFWVEGVDDPDGEVAASLERANASVVPTTRLTTVPAAYWCQIGAKEHLRWVLPDEEGIALDALARLQAAGGLALGPNNTETKYVGAFRAHGLLVPVWDLSPGHGAEALEEPATTFRARLDEALADDRPLSPEARRARAGLIGRQVTLR